MRSQWTPPSTVRAIAVQSGVRETTSVVEKSGSMLTLQPLIGVSATPGKLISDQLVPPLVVLYTPLLKVAYTTFEFFGSMANPMKIPSPGAIGAAPVSVHCAPPFSDL